MREKELRRLFERLVVIAAAPMPLAASVSSCSGNTAMGGATGGAGDASVTGGGGSSSTTTSQGLGGFLGTVVMTGGTRANGGSSSTSTSQGLGGFLGTVVMTGGTSAVGSTVSGAGGFLGTVILLGGSTSMNSAPQRVTCPDAVSNSTGGVGIIPCQPPFCVQADTSALGTSALDQTTCTSLCGPSFVIACAALGPSAPSVLKCYPDCTGRRPDGLTDVESFCDDELGQYFSEVAHLEAASVTAFRALGRQLKAFGAPRSLRRAARQAARDEIRHARLGRTLAERFGGRYVRPNIGSIRDVTLETLARENAVEGCVRETYGALLATYQARHALDPEVRAAMQRIALDETRHAAIAWSIARWVEPKLDPDARARVRGARQAAASDLMRELRYEAPERLQRMAGVPATNTAQTMAAALAEQLWVSPLSGHENTNHDTPAPARFESPMSIA